MTDILLVVNAGSSSLKFQVHKVPAAESLAFDYGGQISGIGGPAPAFRVKAASGVVRVDDVLPSHDAADLRTAQHTLTNWMRGEVHRAPIAVGHRIVHGGLGFTQSVVIDEAVLQKLEALAPLAPLHQHNNLVPVRVIRELWPHVTQVACFDTAFHRTHDPVVKRFALPEALYDRGVRRYGFHGLSYDYIAQTLRHELPDVARGRVIVAHLGSGASACAMVDGRSVDSTMGFTALDGLPMRTRPGRLDAGVLLWMLEQGYTHDQIQHLLYNESGLKGLSGLSGDVRDLLASESSSAKRAIDYLIYRSAESLAGLCVAAGGLDALVFTAGIGENSPVIRAGICQRLDWLGITIDAAGNAANRRCISAPNSAIAVYVLPTNEEAVIARQTLDTISR
ncbi:acetate/propionate family kinase [Pusillimonas sp.]|uniref:acetate/propionate family kinase n=1 Tax=Pusillimonas sp. TaxID=3040095 RepID=UPI0029BC24EE|nr:acetate/propionate family kinase [Pusillimonas sp.]MDX3893219.1 acetate/propionate family kinase [Pusillimonas sp.]